MKSRIAVSGGHTNQRHCWPVDGFPQIVCDFAGRGHAHTVRPQGQRQTIERDWAQRASGRHTKLAYLANARDAVFRAGGMFLRVEGNQKEPLDTRIIETPEDVKGTEVLRDDHSGFIVYAPVGSVKKGEVPGLAGRSPSYLVRQIV